MSEQIIEKLNKMHTDIKLITERMQHIVGDVHDHHSMLYGNTREGLKIKVDRIETSIKTVKGVGTFITTIFTALAGWFTLKG